jgi:hypothetical protein
MCLVEAASPKGEQVPFILQTYTHAGAMYITHHTHARKHRTLPILYTQEPPTFVIAPDRPGWMNNDGGECGGGGGGGVGGWGGGGSAALTNDPENTALQCFQGMGGGGSDVESLEASPVKSAQQRTGMERERERERAEEREAREARATRDIIERAGFLCPCLCLCLSVREKVGWLVVYHYNHVSCGYIHILFL